MGWSGGRLQPLLGRELRQGDSQILSGERPLKKGRRYARYNSIVEKTPSLKNSIAEKPVIVPEGLHTLKVKRRLPSTCWKTTETSVRCQEFLGHRDVSTTQIQTHVLNQGPAGGEAESLVDARESD
jgi:hypothetical protein